MIPVCRDMLKPYMITSRTPTANTTRDNTRQTFRNVLAFFSSMSILPENQQVPLRHQIAFPPQDLFELFQVKRFDDIVKSPHLKGSPSDLFICNSRGHYDADVFLRPHDFLQYFQTAHPRHAHIENYQIGSIRFDLLERLGASRCCDNFIVLFAEEFSKEVDDAGFIVNYKYLRHLCNPGCNDLCLTRFVRRRKPFHPNARQTLVPH